MALKTGFPAVSGATQFPDLRLLFAGDIVCDSAGVPRAGVLPANYNPIVTGRADLKVDVAAMSYITVRSGGVIRGLNDGVVQVALAALPTANSRIDILWVRQPMAASPTSDGSDTPIFGWTTGVASATPTRPSTALPAGALEIGQVQVAFNATATNDGTKVTITQTAPFTAFSGGAVPFRSKTALDLWTNATSGQLAQVVTDSDVRLNGTYRWDGSAWSGNEFASWTTLIAGLPDNSVQAGLGSYTLVGASDATFCTLVTNGIQLNRPGTYLVEASFRMDLAATGRVFLSSVAGGIERRSHGMVGDDYSSPNVRTVTVGATPVQVIMGMFKNNGGVNNINGRVTVTRIN